MSRSRASRLTRRTSSVLAAVLLGAAVGIAGAGPASAEPASLTLTFPAQVTVDDTDLPGSIAFLNTTAAPVVLDIFAILPACGSTISPTNGCPAESADPGVFEISEGIGVSSPGTDCDGMTFSSSIFVEPTGVVYLIPAEPMTVAVGETCTVTFTIDVLKAPTIDADPSSPGVQTFHIAATLHDQEEGSETGEITGEQTTTTAGVSTVWRASPTLSTVASPGGPLGTAIHDTATLAGGTEPAGTMTFTVYGPNDATCAGAPAFQQTVAVEGNGQYVSPSFTPATSGTYRWIAAYSGDDDNAPATGACNDPGESVTITGGVSQPDQPDHPPATPTPGPSSTGAPPTPSPDPSSTQPTTEPTPDECAAVIQLAVDVPRITAGNAPTLAGTALDEAGQPCVGTLVTVYEKAYGQTGYTPVATVPTDASGQFTLVVRPLVQTAFGANTAGDTVRSNVVVIEVHTRVTLSSPAAPVPANTARPVTNPVVFAGTLSPGHANAAVGVATIEQSRFVVRCQATTNDTGEFAFTCNLPEGVITAVVFTSPRGGNDRGSRSIRLQVA